MSTLPVYKLTRELKNQGTWKSVSGDSLTVLSEGCSLVSERCCRNCGEGEGCCRTVGKGEGYCRTVGRGRATAELCLEPSLFVTAIFPGHLEITFPL